MIKRIYFGLCQRIISIYYSFFGNHGKVFMFHEVKGDISDNPIYSITPNSFKDFLKLVKEEYRPGDINSIDSNYKEKCFYITFDDVYENVFTEAIPILNEERIPFTVFISTGLIDKDGYLTKEMIKVLADNPLCTIGAHSITHPMMRFVEYEDALKEIVVCKKKIEEIAEKKASLFAFPYGSVYACSIRDLFMVKRVGYKYCFSTIAAPLNKKSLNNKFFIPRINVNEENYKKVIRKCFYL